MKRFFESKFIYIYSVVSFILNAPEGHLLTACTMFAEVELLTFIQGLSLG